MILIDSNILIYSGEEKHRQLRNLFKEEDAVVSIITKLVKLFFEVERRLLRVKHWLVGCHPELVEGRLEFKV